MRQLCGTVRLLTLEPRLTAQGTSSPRSFHKNTKAEHAEDMKLAFQRGHAKYVHPWHRHMAASKRYHTLLAFLDM